MDGFRVDVSYAFRTWRRLPGSTFVALLALTLGIGASSAVFSIVAGVLLRPLPYTDADRLVMLWQDRSGKGGPAREVISPGLFVDWSTRLTSIRGVSAVRNWTPNFTGTDATGNDEPERLTGAAVSSAYFATLGASAFRGRTFTAEDDAPGAPTVAVLSYGLWHRRFGDDPTLIGRSIVLDGQSVPVIGVMPPDFKGAVIDADVWSTLRIDPANAPRGIIMLQAIGRLAPGVSFDGAQTELSTLQGQLQREDDELTGARARLVTLKDDVVGPARPVVMVLGASVGLVLLIACANVASILTVRAEERRTEMSIRVALGADRGRLVRQLLIESAMLASFGCAAGLGLAVLSVRYLVAHAPASAPRVHDVRVDGAVLAFTAIAGAIVAMLAGLAPAAAAWRAAVASSLREGSRETRGFTRTRTALVAAEVGAAMALVLGAGLLLRSLEALERVDLGFRPDGLLTASVAPPRGTYRGDDALRGLFDRMRAGASRLPGVESAAITSVLPLSGMQITFDFRIVGQPPPRTQSEAPVASFRSVSPNFFSTMGMRLIEGRGFSEDDRANAPMAVVVNQTLAKRYFAGRSPIGARLDVNGSEATIVGLAADVHHFGPATPPVAEIYVPYAQLGTRMAWIVVRTTGDPAALSAPLRQAMRDVDPGLPLATVRTMSAMADATVAQSRFLAVLVSGFSGVATILALTGVYGLIAYAVSRRTREIGVRMALGANRARVVALVLRQSLLVVAAGVAAGALAGVLLSRLAGSLLFGVAPGDPATIAATASLILIGSLGAIVLPAWRAAHVDPVIALRDE